MKQRDYLKSPAEVELGIKPLVIWGRNKTGSLVCRVEMNTAGVVVYRGERGTKPLASLSWEGLVTRLVSR